MTQSTMDTAVEITLVDSVTGELLADVAAVTRAAYRNGDLVTGLPVADGAWQTPAGVRADLDAGHWLWVATVHGRPAGTVRALPGAAAWTVRRLAVLPSARHLGLGRGLLRVIERTALAAGAVRVELDAVVERGNPAFYARAGYRTTRHFGVADKPLSEVRLERMLAGPPAALAYPDEQDRATSPPGVVRTWWETAHGTACHLAHGTAAELDRHRHAITSVGLTDPVLRGVDCLPGDPAGMVPRLRAGTVAGQDHQDREGVVVFPLHVAALPGFAQPRLLHGELLAWWRIPGRPGRSRGNPGLVRALP